MSADTWGHYFAVDRAINGKGRITAGLRCGSCDVAFYVRIQPGVRDYKCACGNFIHVCGTTCKQHPYGLTENIQS